MAELKYKRILLKLSGEALGGKSGFGIDVDEAESIASRIKEVREMGVDVAVVIGAERVDSAVVLLLERQRLPGHIQH